jgi:hypothetical protein
MTGFASGEPVGFMGAAVIGSHHTRRLKLHQREFHLSQLRATGNF